jgi:hypothetical protein
LDGTPFPNPHSGMTRTCYNPQSAESWSCQRLYNLSAKQLTHSVESADAVSTQISYQFTGTNSPQVSTFGGIHWRT